MANRKPGGKPKRSIPPGDRGRAGGRKGAVNRPGERLKVSVSEHEVQERVTLLEESVEAERNRVDRALKPEEADKAFQERTIEMTETREKPVVSKQAHVVEEVVLTKHSGEREVTVSGTVRRQDVTVEDIGGKSGNKRF